MPTNDLDLKKLKKLGVPKILISEISMAMAIKRENHNAAETTFSQMLIDVATRLLAMGDVIEKYAYHGPDCNYPCKCTCGYDDAIAEIKGEG